MKGRIFTFLIVLSLVSCQSADPNPQVKSAEKEKLDKIWYQGKAEVNVYSLSQNRYRDIHPGEAVLIFVTEDFLTDKQVKNDAYTGKSSINVLKNNQIRRFTTGLYDYAMFTSVFTDPHDRQTLKTTMSSQDWCGQSYMQFNYRKKALQGQMYSYFENEGDQTFTIPHVMMEDALFNLLRINPKALPEGKFDLLPSSHILRLLHLPSQSVQVEAQHKKYSGEDFDNTSMVYSISFPSLQRKLDIMYSQSSPYNILGWTDTYPSVFDKVQRTTIAKAKSVEWIDYWSKNGVQNMDLRNAMGLGHY